jgi:hypothetical protein
VDGALVLAWAGAVAVIVLFQVVAFVLDRPFSFLSREPQKALDGVWYAGSFSNLGAVMWAVGATACAVAWLALRPRGETLRSPLLHAALLLALLGADDLFLLHDELYVKAVREEIVFGVYLLLFAGYGVVHRDWLQPRGGLLLLPLGLALLVVSAVMDRYWDGHHVFEDGVKFVGIVTLVFFFARAALASLTEAASRPA